MNNKDFTVDFIGIGMSRCGTTWIANCLADHPDICFSSVKEPHFFDFHFNYQKGLEFYKTFFNHCGGEKIKGEFTPEYYLVEEASGRIKEAFPNVKIIVSLRNPMDRAFSHYLYRKRKTGKPKNMSEIFFQQNERKEVQIIRPGFYYRHLNKFLAHFDRRDVLILIHEDSKKDPKEFIRQIYKFLGVNEVFISDSLYKNINTSRNLVFRFSSIQKMYAKKSVMRKYIVGRFVLHILKIFGFNKIVQPIISWNYRGGNKTEKEIFPSDIRKKLYGIYTEDIKKLEEYLDRNLSFWK